MAAEKRAAAEAAARRVTVATAVPAASLPPGQRELRGYRLVKKFSDARLGRHRIIEAGTIVTEKAEVERLARAGALLDPVEMNAPDHGA